MNRALYQQMAREVPKRLAELLAVPPGRVRVERPAADARERPDMVVSAGGRTFFVECKASGQAAAVAAAVRQLKEYAGLPGKKGLPLVAVPFMGDVGKRLCAEAGIGWLDLSGNAHLEAPGLRISIEGKPNLFKRPGRPRSVFAPKSSRIARCLLLQPGRAFTQRELANASGLDEGFTSRIVRQLEADRLVTRSANGAVEVTDAGALVDTWREVYDFSRHQIVRGHVAARSSDEILRQVANALAHDHVEYAVTGLAGAWLINAFAGFRLVAVYVSQLPSPQVQQAMGFREESRGENVWLVVPNDEGVFHGATEREGIRCAHPVQVYLDLKDHPERSAEAAEQLRRVLLARKAQ
ncbi:MAG: MarR family transcriptional regulator [Verrucomicrobia bacterium]|nr:MarR family transcriptional regulator [Verrucomicrobiota bacterium]